MHFTPRLQVLSDEQVRQIHQAALDILWQTGVLVKAPAARELLRQAGAVVDEENLICRLPADLVETALKKAPADGSPRLAELLKSS